MRLAEIVSKCYNTPIEVSSIYDGFVVAETKDKAQIYADLVVNRIEASGNVIYITVDDADPFRSRIERRTGKKVVFQDE